MKVGYASVSTHDEGLNSQYKALKEAGCEIVHEDGVAETFVGRPGLAAALGQLKSGDVLVVCRLERLGCSLSKLVDLLIGIGQQGADFQAVEQSIDTTMPGGRMVFQALAAMAVSERALLSQRTRAGLDSAKRRGKKLGRRPKMTVVDVWKAHGLMHIVGDQKSVAEIMKVSTRTLRRVLARPIPEQPR